MALRRSPVRSRSGPPTFSLSLATNLQRIPERRLRAPFLIPTTKLGHPAAPTCDYAFRKLRRCVDALSESASPAPRLDSRSVHRPAPHHGRAGAPCPDVHAPPGRGTSASQAPQTPVPQVPPAHRQRGRTGGHHGVRPLRTPWGPKLRVELNRHSLVQFRSLLCHRLGYSCTRRLSCLAEVA
jgi:hypothetical protein